MNNTLFIVLCGLVGLGVGFGVTALATDYQLDQVVQSAETLQLSPTATSGGSLAPTGGGSCAS